MLHMNNNYGIPTSRIKLNRYRVTTDHGNKHVVSAEHNIHARYIVRPKLAFGEHITSVERLEAEA